MVRIFFRTQVSSAVLDSKYLAVLEVAFVERSSDRDMSDVISKNNCPNLENESSVMPGTAKNSVTFFGKVFDNDKSTLSLRTALGGIELSLEIYD